MNILKYKVKKNNLYEVTLENNQAIELFSDVILKYELLLKKSISEKELAEIVLFNEKIKAYQDALKFLNTKLRTEQEIKKKLNSYNKDTINYVLERLKIEKYLNDDLYIKSYINDAVNLKLIGPNKIKIELKKLGFLENDINNYLDSLDNPWIDKIEKYITKKISSNHNLSSNMLKQKMINELMQKGFYKEDIISCLDNIIIEDNETIKNKEYIKIKKRLSKKYSGEELEYRINMALRSKGW